MLLFDQLFVIKRLRACDHLNNLSFKNAIGHIRQHAYLTVGLFAVVIAMDRCSVVESLGDFQYAGVGVKKGVFDCALHGIFDASNQSSLGRISEPIKSEAIVRRRDYPIPYTGRTDDYWHRPPVSVYWPPLPPIGSLYNGLAVAIEPNREIFYVENGKRRSIPNMDTLASLNLNVEIVLRFQLDDEENHIPIGQPLPPCTNC